ncbi:ATP-binding cassette domain-containing protein [Streptomyces scopuliridis]|uniref:ATP-binding cassette domain-containing protein n=1 Tax=Streptomyces scopuliridis TaxID=452529 RepID=UPI0036CE0F00
MDLTVAQGELVASLSPNGAGKSPTIGLVCTTLRPATGHAQVAGADITRAPTTCAAGSVASFRSPLPTNT